MGDTIRIISAPTEVGNFVDLVRCSADEHRDAFGFLPDHVYREAANQKKLLVAVESDTTGAETYAGHVMFGGVYPHGRIFQIFVVPAFRKSGVSTKLLGEVVRRFEAEGYLGIRVRVAADLHEADSFWERNNFHLVNKLPGGSTKGRTIHLRVRDLETPSLLNLMQPIPKLVPRADLRLTERFAGLSPVYAIDLNVLLDTVRNRPRGEAAGAVIRAGLRNRVRIAVCAEFLNELKRNTKPGQTDPLLELAQHFPSLTEPPAEKKTKIAKELARIIFPHREATGNLRARDQSDLAHLATAIHHQTAGFITSEDAILQNRELIRSTYQLDVLGVGEFSAMVDIGDEREPLSVVVNSADAEVRVSDLSENRLVDARRFLERSGVHRRLISDTLAAGSIGETRRRLVVSAGDTVIAYAAWSQAPGSSGVVELFLCADEAHPSAEAVVDYVVDAACADVSKTSSAMVQMTELPGHSQTRHTAITHGFRPVDGRTAPGVTLQKICIGEPVGNANWGRIRTQLAQAYGLGLPQAIPDFISAQKGVSLDSPSGSKITVFTEDLESLLGPVLFLFPGRDGVIVPIRQEYADELLGTAAQASFLASPVAALRKERAYFSGRNTSATLIKGSPILFYESGKGSGRGAVVAAGRIVRTRLVEKSDIDDQTFRRGVLDQRTLDRLNRRTQVVATTFDNILRLKEPVRFRRLKEIAKIDDANLVTARRITAERLQSVLAEGKLYV